MASHDVSTYEQLLEHAQSTSLVELVNDVHFIGNVFGLD